MTLGLAGSFVKTDVKHKNFKAGDKTKLDTFMFSIYGIQQLTEAWFLQAHVSYASSKVKNTEKRITLAGSQMQLVALTLHHTLVNYWLDIM
jgi:outer membrane autotransporter protein